MRSNVRHVSTTFTHEGGPAVVISPHAQLRRSVMSCLLFEKQFYEDGQEISDRIRTLVRHCDPVFISQLANGARTEGKLRHVPLLLARELCRHPGAVGGFIAEDTIYSVIQRADEITEFVAMYMGTRDRKDAGQKLSAQAKRGLARAFAKFDEYQFAKYNRRDALWRFRDVMFMVHPRSTVENKELFSRIASDTLATPDTWEVGLSTGGDKAETFTRLLTERKLGYLALLRNLRNMVNAHVDDDLIRRSILERRGAQRVLPFRYVAAARAVPQLEHELDTALQQSIRELPVLDGTTYVLVDVSASMRSALSGKSDLTRMDAAAALASIVTSNKLRVFTFSNDLVEVPPRRGMAGIDIITNSQPHSGTYLGKAILTINSMHGPKHRLIVITDEQSHDVIPDPEAEHAYLINVASYQNGVGYRRWVHIDGFSENVLRFIHSHESGRMQ